jgi:hypothetical protein
MCVVAGFHATVVSSTSLKKSARFCLITAFVLYDIILRNFRTAIPRHSGTLKWFLCLSTTSRCRSGFGGGKAPRLLSARWMWEMVLYPGKEPRVPLVRRFDVYSVGRAIHSSVSFWGLWHHVVLQVASCVLEEALCVLSKRWWQTVPGYMVSLPRRSHYESWSLWKPWISYG